MSSIHTSKTKEEMLTKRRNFINIFTWWFATMCTNALTSCGNGETEKTERHLNLPSEALEPNFDLKALSIEFSSILGRDINLVQQGWIGTPHPDYKEGQYISLVHDNPEDFIFKIIIDQRGEKCHFMIRELPGDTVFAQIPWGGIGTNLTLPVKNSTLVEKVVLNRPLGKMTEAVNEYIISGEGSRSIHLTNRIGQFGKDQFWEPVVKWSPALTQQLLSISSDSDAVEIIYGSIEVHEKFDFSSLHKLGYGWLTPVETEKNLKILFWGQKSKKFKLRYQKLIKINWEWVVREKDIGDIALRNEDWKLVIIGVDTGG